MDNLPLKDKKYSNNIKKLETRINNIHNKKINIKFKEISKKENSIKKHILSENIKKHKKYNHKIKYNF